MENGCLYVVPGSHREPVLMDPGDLLLFDSHLMHFSTDNRSSRRRAAMVYHYARAGTVDHTVETRGYSINDWMPVRRGTPGGTLD